MSMAHGKSGVSGHPAAIPVAQASKQGRGLVRLPDLEAGAAIENPWRERLAKLFIVQVSSLLLNILIQHSHE